MGEKMRISDQAMYSLPDQALALTIDKKNGPDDEAPQAGEQMGQGMAPSRVPRSAKVAARLRSGGFTQCVHFDAASGQCEREGNCTFDHATNSCNSD